MSDLTLGRAHHGHIRDSRSFLVRLCACSSAASQECLHLLDAGSFLGGTPEGGPGPDSGPNLCKREPR